MRAASRAITAAALAACLANVAVVRAARAQDTPQTGASNPTPPAVKYGKWGAAALFAAFTAAGAIEHNAADDRFRALEQYCISTGPCAIGPDGRYTNPDAESRYQAVVQRDRVARVWFLSGQIAMGGAAALFVVELLHDHGTRNIPYSGLVVEPGKIGLRVPL
ncbi:MAG: hypothetical protein ACHQX4_10155 [Gemmatimonadales bacterium]